MPKLTPKTGTPVPAKRRSAWRIEPSPPSTRQRSTSSDARRDLLDRRGGLAVLGELVRVGDQPPAGLARRRRRRSRPRRSVAGGCEWVISAAVFSYLDLLDRRLEVVEPVAARARTRRRSRGCPSGRAGRRRRSRGPRGRARCAAWATPRIASRRSAGVADDALADPLAAELELGLDHRQQLAARRPGSRRPPAAPWRAR